MNPTKSMNDNTGKFPGSIIWAVCFICVLPFTLNLLGFDFGSHKKPFDPLAASKMASYEMLDAMFQTLSGSFTHTILEWSAFCTALFTVILAFIHFSIKKDPATPILGVALFCSGCMDAFHTLAADRLIEAVADNRNLIPFTWAICRVFNALILITGVSILLYGRDKKHKGRIGFVISISTIFGLLAYGIISYCAHSQNLPQTMFPESTITRPWDVAPLIFFLFAGIFIFPRFFKKKPGLFSQALIIMTIPQVITQLHMAFGSTALFDNHFNIAHFLKIVAYLVPFIGLSLEYIKTYHKLETSIVRITKANIELEQFAYVVSHDLKAPLRAIVNLSQWIEEDLGDKVEGETAEDLALLRKRARRMEALINGILKYSRVGQTKSNDERVDVKAVLDEVVDSLVIPDGFSVEVKPQMPTLMADRTKIIEVFANLINNAIKHNKDTQGRVEIAAHDAGAFYRFTVKDNGPGIAPEFHEKIFTVFQTLEARDKTENTGVGLAIVKKMVEGVGGSVSVDSIEGQGATFIFLWPKASKQDQTSG